MTTPAATGADREALAGYVQAVARLYGMPHAGQQHETWVQRLSLHLSDVLRVGQAPCGYEVGPVTPPSVSAADIRMPAPATQGSDLAQIASGVAQGRIDPLQRVEQCLQRIESQAHLNVFRYVDVQGARARAQDIQRRVAQGEPVGPLAGVVVAVKDCIEVQGMPMTAGTRDWRAMPEHSAPVVRCLEQADAIIIGITTMHELAYGATTDNPHHGRVGNPHDPARVAGGSSGGSSVAVATGMADISLGTDAAGSVRMPASLCGIVGFKPTYDVLGREGGVPLTWSLDHVGLFARNVADIAQMFEVMLGRQAGTAPDGQAGQEPALTLRVPENYFFDIIDPQVQERFDATLQTLRQAGVQVEAVRVNELDLAPALQFLTLCAEATQVHQGGLLQQPDQLGAEVRERLEGGQFLRAVDYIKAQRLRSGLRQALMRHLAGPGELIVTPTVLLPACVPTPRVQVQGHALPIHMALTRCTLPFNLTGLPAISVPCGTTPEGMPVGLQIVAGMGLDGELLHAARRLEALLG